MVKKRGKSKTNTSSKAANKAKSAKKSKVPRPAKVEEPKLYTDALKDLEILSEERKVEQKVVEVEKKEEEEGT